MSMPNIPNINPDINLSFSETINLLLASIAFEELGLSHILNAEGEKLQAGICLAKCFDDLVILNQNVTKTLRAVIKNQMLLQFKLEDTIDLLLYNLHHQVV